MLYVLFGLVSLCMRLLTIVCILFPRVSTRDCEAEVSVHSVYSVVSTVRLCQSPYLMYENNKILMPRLIIFLMMFSFVSFIRYLVYGIQSFNHNNSVDDFQIVCNTVKQSYT